MNLTEKRGKIPNTAAVGFAAPIQTRRNTKKGGQKASKLKKIISGKFSRNTCAQPQSRAHSRASRKRGRCV